MFQFLDQWHLFLIYHACYFAFFLLRLLLFLSAKKLTVLCFEFRAHWSVGMESEVSLFIDFVLLFWSAISNDLLLTFSETAAVYRLAELTSCVISVHKSFFSIPYVYYEYFAPGLCCFLSFLWALVIIFHCIKSIII